MPTISFTITDEDVDRFAKRFAIKLAEVQGHSFLQDSPADSFRCSRGRARIAQMAVYGRRRTTSSQTENGTNVRRVGGVVRLPTDKEREWAEKHSIM